MIRRSVLVAVLATAALGLYEAALFVRGEAAPQALATSTVAAYVTGHISELSPEKEVLGGHYYVTDISVGRESGVVSYEDGHVAYTADFTYQAAEGGGVDITSFRVRKP